jgi:GT2 family glycosyltransferase
MLPKYELMDQSREAPEVDILILNRNGKCLLEECINSIHKSTSYPEYKITVIDNNSSDSSILYLKKHHPNVSIIENERNLGFAEANNKAIKQTDSKYVILLNNDTEVRSNWLTPLVDVAEGNKETKIVSPKLIYEDGDPQYTGDKIILRESGVPTVINKLLSKIEKQFDFKKEIYRGIGAALLIDRDLFTEIGYLDEEYIYYMEEFDFCLRAKGAGFSIKYTPDTTVVHKSRTTSETDPYFEYYLRRKSRIRFYLLNYTISRLLIQVPAEVLTFGHSVKQGYIKWFLKAYLDSLEDIPSILERRKSRSQFHHTTNKIRFMCQRVSQYLN